MHEKVKCVCFIYIQQQKVKFKSVQINMKQVSYLDKIVSIEFWVYPWLYNSVNLGHSFNTIVSLRKVLRAGYCFLTYKRVASPDRCFQQNRSSNHK